MNISLNLGEMFVRRGCPPLVQNIAHGCAYYITPLWIGTFSRIICSNCRRLETQKKTLDNGRIRIWRPKVSPGCCYRKRNYLFLPTVYIIKAHCSQYLMCVSLFPPYSLILKLFFHRLIINKGNFEKKNYNNSPFLTSTFIWRLYVLL